MRPVPSAVAIGTANKNIAQELHLNLLETGPAAALALALTGIKTEGARIETALFSQVRLCEDLPDIIKRADIHGWIRARRLGENRLIDQDDAAEIFAPFECNWVGRFARNFILLLIAYHLQTVGSLQLGGFGAEPGRQRRQQNVSDQSCFT